MSVLPTSKPALYPPQPPPWVSPGVPFPKDVALVDKNGTLGTVIPHTFVRLDQIKDVEEYLREEVSTKELDGIAKHLWMAGLSRKQKPLRPLHRHKVVGREIVVAEQVGLHLTSQGNRIFLKPIPYCLLHHDFYSHIIVSNSKKLAGIATIEAHAIGFLSTYLELIRYPSDFKIAKEMDLLPSIEWDAWLAFALELKTCLEQLPQPLPKTRYDYGELRLDRVNLIMAVFRFRLARPYITLQTTYSAYFQSFITILVVVIFAFVTVALSAFQVISGNPAAASPTLLSAGYWFAVITLFVLALSMGGPVLWLVILALDNLLFALGLKGKRK